MTATMAYPTAGETWRTPPREAVSENLQGFPEATLTVTEVFPGDPRGREVRGWVEYPTTLRDLKEGPNRRPYACDLKVFHWVWRHRGKRLETNGGPR